LTIYQANSDSAIRATANKWKFQDAMMGEQFITLTITSEKPINWAVGDWCEFRGEVFTLNYIPSVTQKARTRELGDAYTYDNIKFDSRQEELTRCTMLDVTPTTGDYIAALGTNHTGSARFQLFCGETSVVVGGQRVTLTPVCALAAKMQANLDRFYPTLGWRVLVDVETTYTTATGKTVLVTHTDDKVLSFDNTTVSAALAEVQNTFDLDFCVKGRTIYIGFSLDGLTGDEDEDVFAFGYGRGYPTHDNPGTGLFQIKQIANSQQKIVTRLRALGSTKNMPYRYYNKKYGGDNNPELTQTLFPTNLQLPGTFLPEGEREDAANPEGDTKWARNNARGTNLRAVKGDTNDSYIDKNDDAENCPEGVREDCARWDGSNSELPEIYPTIEGVTFGELRAAGVADMDGNTGSSSFQGTSVHPDEERVDSLLAVGYVDGGTLIDDANIGDGINPEQNTVSASVFTAVVGQRKLMAKAGSGSALVTEGDETELFVVKDVAPGRYFMSPTGPSYSSVVYGFRLSSGSADVGFIVRVWQRVGQSMSLLAEFNSDTESVSDALIHEMFLPELPDSVNTPNETVPEIKVTSRCDVVVTFTPFMSDVHGGGVVLTYQVGRSRLNPNSDYDPEYNWGNADSVAAVNGSFHVFVKDMGFDLSSTFNGDTPVVAMKSGRCVGREFEIGSNVVPSIVGGVKGYILTLNRAQDSNLNTYYPSAVDPISAGDSFVLLGISLPDMYVRAAEARLLMAASDYLADNCETKYTYQPSIDEIFVQRQYDNLRKAGAPEKSIFWRLYAGLRFLFRGVPSVDGDPLPLIDVTIEHVVITMGDGLVPKIEITLNDDIQQSTIQRLTTAVDRIYNGSAYSAGGGASAGALYEILTSEGGRMFLSKVKDDIAEGKITFNDIVTALGLVKAKAGINIGDFMSGFLGGGAHIGSDGSGEFEDVTVRGAIKAAELIFNRISAEDGEVIYSIGHGEIESVTETSSTRGTATLKLDGDEWATIKAGDICRGLYNTIGKDYDNADAGGFDVNGFRGKKGFFASYFRVTSVSSNAKGSCVFNYVLQSGSEHPCPLMKFAVYGNANSSEKERQSSIYITSVGIAPRLLFLAGVNTWSIKPENVKIVLGNVQDVSVWQEVTESEYNDFDGTEGEDKKTTTEIVDGVTVTHYILLKNLVGDAGFYCEDNVYLGGIIDQFKSAAMEAIESQVSSLGQAWISTNIDRYVIDCDSDGKALGGHSIEITASLFFGSDKCVLDQSVGKCVFSGMGSASAPVFPDRYTARKTYTINEGDSVSSDVVSVTLEGLHNDSVYRTTKSVAIVANRQGASGQNGQNGTNGVNGQDGTNGLNAVQIVTNEDYFVVECDSDGNAINRTEMALSANLISGNDKVVLGENCEFGMGNRAYPPVISQDGTTASRTFIVSKGSVPASKILVNLNATIDGIAYARSKNVYILAVKQGADGQDGNDGQQGNGIETIETKWLSSTKTAGVTVDDAGWSATFLSPTSDAPYLWRWTRFTYTDGSTSDIGPELIAVYQSAPNPNLLNDTAFKSVDMMDAWTSVGKLIGYDGLEPSNYVVSTVNGTGGHKAFNVMFMGSQEEGGEAGYIEYLVQPIYQSNSNRKVELGKWHTLSFWLYGSNANIGQTSGKEFVLQLDMTGIYDTSAGVYVDGVYQQNPEDVLSFGPSTTWERRTVTFKTPSTYSGIKNISFVMQTMKANQIIRMCMPKLEAGMIATDYVDGAFTRQPAPRATHWELGMAYQQGSIGERWLDLAEYEGRWYQCLRSHTSSSSNKPVTGTTTAYWQPASQFGFVATDLLLAERGVINLLYGNTIFMRNAKNQLTASMNDGGTGNYVIYYPESGKKMMEFSSEGYIYYYNDDADNTRAWRLGHGGNILNNESDDWKPRMLYKLPSDAVNFAVDQQFNRSVYYEFKSGSDGSYVNYNGSYYTSHINDNPAYTNALAATGWYTPDLTPWQKLSDDGDTTVYCITMYRITKRTADGITTSKITETKVRCYDGTNYYFEES